MPDAPAADGAAKTPADFLKSIRGKPVVVKLNSGVDYRGILACLDGYMNIAMEQTEVRARTRTRTRTRTRARGAGAGAPPFPLARATRANRETPDPALAPRATIEDRACEGARARKRKRKGLARRAREP
jgi:small nuclear ribonucleoprotein (snRNP)-like protein